MHQVVVYRDGGLMYYCYMYGSGAGDTIGMCFATGSLCVQLKALFDKFADSFVHFAKRGVIMYFDSDGVIRSNADFVENVGEVEELFRWIKDYNESGSIEWDKLPPEDHTITKGASVWYNFDEDDPDKILKATLHYTYVYITLKNPIPTSYASTVKRLNDENKRLNDEYAALVREKEEWSRQIDKINKKKKKFYWPLIIAPVVMLVVAVVMFVVLQKSEPVHDPSYDSDSVMLAEEMVVEEPVSEPHHLWERSVPRKTAYGYWIGGYQSRPDTSALAMQGEGLLRYNNNDKDGRQFYYGYMNMDKRDGMGLLLWKSGVSYQGLFKNDSVYKGILWNPQKKKYYKGEFKHDKPFTGCWYSMDDNEMLQEFENGEIKE